LEIERYAREFKTDVNPDQRASNPIALRWRYVNLCTEVSDTWVFRRARCITYRSL